MIILSPKYKEFLQVKCKREFLEGTTAAGKTTIGIFKFMCLVADSDKKFHVIAGDDVGTTEKNVINSENGLLEQFEGCKQLMNGWTLTPCFRVTGHYVTH